MAKEIDSFGDSWADKQQTAEIADDVVNVEEAQPVDAPSGLSVDVNEEAADGEVPVEAVPEAHQVEPNYVIFVPFSDFEARINQQEFEFKKGVAVRVKKGDANDWISGDNPRGYVK